MMDQFQELLEELGDVFNLPLHLDKYQACSINIPPVTIQLQLDNTQEKIFLFCKIIEIPPGRFRENVLQEAMKANSQKDPLVATFGYIFASNDLAIFQQYPLKLLNGEMLAGTFGAFFELAQKWHQAIESGRSSPQILGQSPPFGLKP